MVGYQPWPMHTLSFSLQAPEVLRGKPYTYSVDYWSLGCILFEFLAGFPPFSGSTPEETWTNLKNWTKVLRRPEYDKPEDLIFNLSDTAWDAVTRCVCQVFKTLIVDTAS
jgi:serine/threonine protein kinase